MVVFLFASIFLNATERYIGIIIKPDFRGERSFAYRIKSACSHIGWNADVIDLDDYETLRKNKYDFVISLVPGAYKSPKSKNYLAIFHPLHHFFDKNGFMYKRYQSYDGYLLAYLPGDFKKKKTVFENDEKFPYMQWYPTVQKLEIQTTNPRYLFHIPCAWGDRFWDIKFKRCLRLLDKRPYMRFYGDPMFKKYYPKSYKEEISYRNESLYRVLAKAGITLVIHSAEHNKYGLPSGRIFEAAAASTVIICDQNSFVQNHFGDSVLYIDTDSDGQCIHNQIQHHMEWIRTNKIEALEKAKEAHAIFEKKFLLEDQLLKLEEFHNQITLNQ